MKAYKVLIFIIIALGLIVALSFFFPEDGVRVGNVELRFPSPERLLAGNRGDDDASADVTAAIDEQLKSMSELKDSAFIEYSETSPSRFYFPDDDCTLLDPLFEAMDSAGKKAVKIVHYGDSQLEEDNLTYAFRSGLQSRFGGGGAGTIPVVAGYYTRSISESVSPELTRHMAFGLPEFRSNSSQYGPMAQSSRLDSSAYISFHSLKSNMEPARYFNRVSLVVANAPGGVSVRCGGSAVKVATCGEDDLGWATFELPDSTVKGTVSVSGHCDLMGLNFYSDRGISVDNVAMRGCSGTIFTRLKAGHLKEYYDSTNTRLIILQYGGNGVTYLKREKEMSEYGATLRKQIEYVHAQAPDAVILFIGPSDMATSVKGEIQTRPNLPALIDTIKATAVRSGAVYWDMCQAMGGYGSMVKWVKASPALAGQDYTHFTKKGSDVMGNMLFQTLMVYYDHYRWRKDTQAAVKNEEQ